MDTMSLCAKIRKMRMNSRTACVNYDYDQADLKHDEPLKENIAFQCSDGVESGHKRTNAHHQAESFAEDHHVAVDTTSKQQTSGKRKISFSPESCTVVHHIDHQTEGLEHQLWYSQSDFIFFEDQAWLCSQMILEGADQGSFDGDMGHILGLEKMLLCDSYLDRRTELRNAVLDEHAIQSLAKEIRWQRRREGCETDLRAEDVEIFQLAATSERNSNWAKDRALMAALALEHDLAPSRPEENLLFDGDRVFEHK